MSTVAGAGAGRLRRAGRGRPRPDRRLGPRSPRPGRSYPSAGACHPSVARRRLPQRLPAGRLRRSRTGSRPCTSAPSPARAPTGGTPPQRRLGRHAGRAGRVRHGRSTRRLGADWRPAGSGLTVVLPSPQAWRGGARWYRCDVTEIASIDDTAVDLRTGSLRGALSGSGPAGVRLLQPEGWSRTTSTRWCRCVLHRQAPRRVRRRLARRRTAATPAFTGNAKRTHRACQTMIAKYAKVPDNSDARSTAPARSTTSPYEEEWRNGNRGVQCFLWISDRDLTRLDEERRHQGPCRSPEPAQHAAPRRHRRLTGPDAAWVGSALAGAARPGTSRRCRAGAATAAPSGPSPRPGMPAGSSGRASTKSTATPRAAGRLGHRHLRSRPGAASRSRRRPRRPAGPPAAPRRAAPAAAGSAAAGRDGWRRQRDSGRRRSEPRPVHGASTSTRSKPPSGRSASRADVAAVGGSTRHRQARDGLRDQPGPVLGAPRPR